MNDKAVATKVEVDGSAPSLAQSKHKQQVTRVHAANTRAPSSVSSCGSAANSDFARRSGRAMASTTDTERRPATIRSQTRRARAIHMANTHGCLANTRPVRSIITHQYIHSRSDHTKHKTFTQSLQAKSRKEDSKHSNHASHTITDKRGSHTSSRRERRCTALSRSQTRTRLQSRQPQRGKGSGTHWARGGPREDGVRTARGALLLPPVVGSKSPAAKSARSGWSAPWRA